MSRGRIPLVTAAVGLVLILTSLNWTSSSSFGPTPQWSEQQAQEYARAATEYHYHTYHQRNTADSSSSDQTTSPLEVAEQRYLERRAALEAARSRPRIWAAVLAWSGIALAAGGLVGFFFVRRDRG